jgi:hypothetical protein
MWPSGLKSSKGKAYINCLSSLKIKIKGSEVTKEFIKSLAIYIHVASNNVRSKNREYGCWDPLR